MFLSRIQRFSTADGDGIRTTVFFGGCNLRCPWCHNPETQEQKKVVLRFPQGKDQSSGEEKSVDEILAVILRDKDFYDESGGGVTLSGGEPLLQRDCHLLAEKCKQAGISVIVDTAGCVPFENFEKVLPFTDCFFFDVKGGEDAYRKIGGDYALMCENLVRLARAGACVVARMPIVPGVNADMKTARKNVALLKKAGVTRVDLLPYHKYGISKYGAMGKEYTMKKTRFLAKGRLTALRTFYEAQGFTVKTGK